MKIEVKRAELIDDFWRDGLLLDSTYLRALVVDGITPAEAAKRLKRLRSEGGRRRSVADFELTMVSRQ